MGMSMGVTRITATAFICGLTVVFTGCGVPPNSRMEPPRLVEVEKYLELYERRQFLCEPELMILNRKFEAKIVAKEFGNAWGFIQKPKDIGVLVFVPGLESSETVYVNEMPDWAERSDLLFVYYECGFDALPIDRER